MGGLSKKGFQLQKLAGDSGLPHLALDAGDLLFKHASLPPGQEEQEKLTASAIAEAYTTMGYKAVCVGSQDLAAGTAYLQTLAQGKEVKFSWLSANLVKKSTKKPIFKTNAAFKVGSITVGVIGLTGPAKLEANDSAIILPWEQVLPSLMAKMAKKHNLVILLSNLPTADNQRIAANYPGIHLIIQSGASASTNPHTPVNNSLIAATLPQGKQIGILEITWQTSKQWEPQAHARLIQTQNALNQIEAQLSQFPDSNQETALHDQPERLKAWQALHTRELALRKEIDTLSHESVAHSQIGTAFCSYANRFADMQSTLPDHPGIKAIISRLDSELSKLARQRRPHSPPPSQSP